MGQAQGFHSSRFYNRFRALTLKPLPAKRDFAFSHPSSSSISNPDGHTSSPSILKS
ncbi:unnamed protein product, partial [Linum tenue]